MAVLALAGVSATVAVQRADEHTTHLREAEIEHLRIGRALATAESALTRWVDQGDRSGLRDFRDARVYLLERRVDLARELDGDRSAALEAEDEAVDAWLDGYAAAAEDPTDDATTPSRARGAALLDTADEAYDVAADRLTVAVDSAATRATWTFRVAVGALVALGALAVLAAQRGRSRLVQVLVTPLARLEAATQHSGRRQPGVRAPVDGPAEVRAIARAINDLLGAQERARAAERRLQGDQRALDAARHDFASNVSHELRTPLTTIHGQLEVVADEFEGRMDPRHERMLAAAQRNVERLTTLIDDLLLSADGSQRATALLDTDLGSLLAASVADVALAAGARGVRIEVAPLRGSVVLRADPPALQRAITDLLSNAVKFSRDGGLVEVQVVAGAHEVQVMVTDHGIGVPSAEQPLLGTRFFRASNAVRLEIAGTGLGLRRARTAAVRHGGDLVVRSVEDEGTTVTVRLSTGAR
ncbi:unannotated protein [freshwater metagenome]|uniref:histidine kinase n=1 Tax=freshwater metagenome TaxID=449393 RepID=A0A6J6QB61_9ZZZZ